MFKKGWIVSIAFLLYGGCAALFASFIFQWGRIAILISIGVVLISFLLSWWKLRCPHCKKMSIPVKSMMMGIKVGRCNCETCGEEIRIK